MIFNCYFIHGYNSSSSIFEPLIEKLVRNLDMKIHPFNYETNDKIETNANKFGEMVKETFYQDAYNLIIAHSMGCIVARWFLQFEHESGINLCVLIAGPNKGTYLAKPFQTLSPGLEDITPDSITLNCLNANKPSNSTKKYNYKTKYIVVLPELDIVIIPKKSSKLKGATEWKIPKAGHSNIFKNEIFLSKITEYLLQKEKDAKLPCNNPMVNNLRLLNSIKCTSKPKASTGESILGFLDTATKLLSDTCRAIGSKDPAISAGIQAYDFIHNNLEQVCPEAAQFIESPINYAFHKVL